MKSSYLEDLDHYRSKQRNKRKNLKEMLSYLEKIDNILDKLDAVDIYGDIIQNFCDSSKERQTKRLIEMVKEDLNNITK